jgi:Tfp pilus assembly protein PilN
VSQVNLLPREILQAHETKRLTLLVAAGGAGLALFVILFFLMQTRTLAGVNEDIAAQEATNRTIEAEIVELQRYEDLEVRAQQKQALLAAAYASEVAFSGILMDLSRITPNDSYLTSFTGAVQPPAAGGEGTAPAFVGNLALAGEAIGFDTLSTWLTRLEQVDGWVNPWTSSIARTGDAGDRYTFSTSVDLTQDVVTPRGRGAVTAGG